MAKKPQTIIKQLNKANSPAKEKKPIRIDIDYRSRDMREEALNMGSHGAKEIWGDKK